jgi:hypothetical protein
MASKRILFDFGLSARLPVDKDQSAPIEEIHGRVNSFQAGEFRLFARNPA